MVRGMLPPSLNKVGLFTDPGSQQSDEFWGQEVPITLRDIGVLAEREARSLAGYGRVSQSLGSFL
jgi:hypothetical protein